MFRHFNDMCWPACGERLNDLEWACRYANDGLTQSDFMCLAGIVSAYRELIALPTRQRNQIIAELRQGPSERAQAPSQHGSEQPRQDAAEASRPDPQKDQR